MLQYAVLRHMLSLCPKNKIKNIKILNFAMMSG